MPIKNLFKKSKENNSFNGSSSMSDKERKSLLGLKSILAQQNPQLVYDLSDCGCSELPSDTYTFCKLLGKTSLNLKKNCLSSLESGGTLQDLKCLKSLNVCENKIEKLPNDFGQLTYLKILNVSFNRLKYLPDSLIELQNLEELNISNNKFAKFPIVVCSLAKLQSLFVNNNQISFIPNDLFKLHQTLQVLELDFKKIKNIPSDFVEKGLGGVMDFFCRENGITYEGPSAVSEDTSDNSSQTHSNASPDESIDDVMIQYMRKKQDQLKAQLFEEERMREAEKQQLEHALLSNSKSKQGIFQEITRDDHVVLEFEEKKKEKANEKIEIEKMLREIQSEELDVYLTNSTNKDDLLLNLVADNENLHQEVEAIVSAKERERLRLLQDLSKGEQETDLALQELISLQQSQKSVEYVKLLTEQEDQMQSLLSNIAESSAELRRCDILKEMHKSLVEEALIASQRDKVEEEKKSWVTVLLNEGKLNETEIKSFIKNKEINNESFLASILKEEACQAEAFKLLLLKLDLKRNNIIRQIAMIEYELSRLSSLDIRKKRFGVQYGSTTMLDQRKTLVGLLKSLLKAKGEREVELDDWVYELSNRHQNLSSEDFWLLQYQKLMSMKPSSISKAEEYLDETVLKILTSANAVDLVPIFATHNISFSSLLEMGDEDYAKMGIGAATNHSIQRALHSYLASSKVGIQEPSAPLDEESAAASTFGEESADVHPTLLDDIASAPQVDDQFFESECVVCLSNGCHVLFIPCGHVCVCGTCCQTLSTCPLCRADITNKCYIGSK